MRPGSVPGLRPAEGATQRRLGPCSVPRTFRAYWRAARLAPQAVPARAPRRGCASPCTCAALAPGASRLSATGPEPWQAAQELDSGAEFGREVEAAGARPVSASLSRAVFAVQPGRVATQALRGRGRTLSVPSTLLVLVLTVGTAVWTALHQRLQTVRECKTCKGFGIQRCKLCAGRGRISWEGKLAHEEPCPMCLGRRYTKCTCCGGHVLARATFMHLDTPGDAALVDALARLDQRGAGAAGAAAGAAGSAGRRGGQQLIEQLDALANEIMTD